MKKTGDPFVDAGIAQSLDVEALRRREAMLAQVRVEDHVEFVHILPLPHANYVVIRIRKPVLGRPQEIYCIPYTLNADDAERLGLALQQAAELARVLDAKFKEEHGIA